jgi:hypothetical protein
MEKTMTTNPYESAFDIARQAFAPFGDAFKGFQDQAQVPQAARDFVKRFAGDATAGAENIHAGAEQVTVAIQTAVAEQVEEAAKISRSIQQAMLEDTQAFFAAIEKLASAQSLGETIQIQSEIVRARTDVAVARARATADYLGERFATGARTAQENLSRVASLNKAA